MALIEVRGYFNKPESRESRTGGTFQTFTLAEKQKGRNGQPDTRVYYDVAVFKEGLPVIEDGMYGTVKGYLNIRSYEKDGQKRFNLSISAQEIELSERTNTTAQAAPAKDPWDDIPAPEAATKTEEAKKA